MKARLVKFGEIEVEGERYTYDVMRPQLTPAERPSRKGQTSISDLSLSLSPVLRTLCPVEPVTMTLGVCPPGPVGPEPGPGRGRVRPGA
jgi:hypothetical protein